MFVCFPIESNHENEEEGEEKEREDEREKSGGRENEEKREESERFREPSGGLGGVAGCHVNTLYSEKFFENRIMRTGPTSLPTEILSNGITSTKIVRFG